MTIKHQRKGYIIVMTMLIIALAVAIVTYIYKRGTVYNPLAQLIAHKEKARMLTMSGLQIALAKLGAPLEKKKDEKNKQESPPQDATKDTPGQKKGAAGEQDISLLYQTLLPRLNRWQRFVLKEEIDGVDAEIRIAISCEEGKINLNQIYDFDKKQFRKTADKKVDWEAIFKELCTVLEKQMNGKELFDAFKKFLNGRTQPFNDVTELLLIKEFEFFKDTIFYDPPAVGTKTDKSVVRPLYLTDLFTLYTNQHEIDPWLFSDSVCCLFGLPRAQSSDFEDRVKIMEPVLKNIKSTYTWKSDWKPSLEPIYQKELQSLPKGIESVLQATTKPTIFSVTISATYGRVTQRLYVIVERTKKKDAQVAGYDVEVRKVYRV